MKYVVVRDCHGFMFRYWEKGTIVDSEAFSQDTWKKQPLPVHFVELTPGKSAQELIEEAEIEEVNPTPIRVTQSEKPEKMSVKQVATTTAGFPETANNPGKLTKPKAAKKAKK